MVATFTSSKTGSRDREAEDLIDRMKYAWNQHRTSFRRLEGLQKDYDNVVKKENWPTISKIPIAHAFAAVEQHLSEQYEFAFPPYPFAKLFPREENLDIEVIKKDEWALYVTLMHRMKIQQTSVRSLKDCVKLGLGYSIVEPVTVKPLVASEYIADTTSTRMMELGRERTTLRQRYINVGRVLPWVSGVDFNGDDRVPYAWFTDSYDVWRFRDQFADGTDKENAIFKDDVEEYIQAAKERGLSGTINIAETVDSLGGIDSRLNGTKPSTSNEDVVDPVIPVIKCYMPNKHVYIGIGQKGPKVLWKQEGEAPNYRCPLIRWSAWPDMDRWFPMSEPEANRRNYWVKNTWVNLLLDMMSLSGKPPFMYDSTALQKPPQINPSGKIGIPGDVKTTGKFLEGPRLDPTFVQAGQVIDQSIQMVSGDSDLTRLNYTRGGSMAFQDLLASTEGRKRFRARMVEMSAIQNIVEQTLLYLQLNTREDGEEFRAPAWDSDTGREIATSVRVGAQDLVHVFDVLLDLRSQERRGAMDQATEQGRAQIMLQSPYFDHYQIAREKICQDELEAQRLMKSRDEIQAAQARREQAEERGMELGLQQKQRNAQNLQRESIQGAIGGGA